MGGSRRGIEDALVGVICGIRAAGFRLDVALRATT